MIEKLNLKNKYRKLNAADLYLFGKGGTDITGEWYSNGSMYAHVSKIIHETNHNYQIDIDKLYVESGFTLSIHVCLNMTNSRDYKVLNRTRFKTAGEAIWFAIEFISEYEASTRFNDEIIKDLDKRRRPVFELKNDQLIYIGQSIFGACSDFVFVGNQMLLEQFRYYEKDFPKYHPRYYSATYYDVEAEIVNKTEIQPLSRCCSGIIADKEPELYNRIIAAAAQYKTKTY